MSEILRILRSLEKGLPFACGIKVSEPLTFLVSGRAFKFRLSAFLTAGDRLRGASRPPIPGGDCNLPLVLLRSCHLALKIVVIVKFKPDLLGLRT